MKLAELSEAEVARRLRGKGLHLHSGPFVFELRSSLPEVTSGLLALYCDHQVEAEADFADFHVRLDRAVGLRGWAFPEVDFYLDGVRPYLSTPRVAALALLEWGLNWCIANYAHTYLMIHCAVLARGGDAIILPAPPESGKSTLCAAMACEGWRLLSDEHALVDPRSQAITPLVRPIGLKNDSIELIGRRYPEATLGPTSSRTPKGRVAHVRPPPASVAAVRETATPRWVVFPKFTPGVELSLTGKPKSRAFMQLVENTNNYHHLGANGFSTVVEIIDRAECYDLKFSSLDDALRAVANVAGS